MVLKFIVKMIELYFGCSQLARKLGLQLGFFLKVGEMKIRFPPQLIVNLFADVVLSNK